MVVISWSDHRGNWRDAGFSNDASTKISKPCHRVTVVGGQCSIQLSYGRTYFYSLPSGNLYSIPNPNGKCKYFLPKIFHAPSGVPVFTVSAGNGRPAADGDAANSFACGAAPSPSGVPFPRLQTARRRSPGLMHYPPGGRHFPSPVNCCGSNSAAPQSPRHRGCSPP